MHRFLKYLSDCLTAVPLLILGNAVFFWSAWTNGKISIKIIMLIFLLVYYLICLFFPERKKAESYKLGILSHGIRLIRQGCICSVVQIPVLISQLQGAEIWNMLINQLIFCIMLAGIFLGGLLRVGISAKQVKIHWYLALFFCWAIPGINLILFHHISKIARHEFYVERAKAELNISRQKSEICRTKYPVLLVHGIFFRDWQLFNYWGRIPAELKKNGARIFYGKQQSAQSIAKSAEELHKQIQIVLEQAGAEKVNIIAHSKGGLDSRYAIAQLGDASHVASLTTINTPHHGCAWVDDILQKIPLSVQNWLDKKYQKIFQVLGDTNPEFLEGVKDLTAVRSHKFNAECPVPDDLFCQCYMSEMSRAFSAPFPLWFSFLCMKQYDRNAPGDGLVPTDSAKLTDRSFTVLKSAEKRGISHGDMIDLNRENISGFDVREFYVNLLKDLKEKGF